jgi:hypothetical protein
MTWFSRPNKNGDVFEKISETEPTGPPKKVTSKGMPTKVSVPFFKIQSPLFEKLEGEDVEVSFDSVNLPEVISTDDFELFSKEAKLTGWEVKKVSRTKADVHAEGYKAHYTRRGKRWRLQRVTKFDDGLKAYKMPLTKLVEQNSIKDIEAIEDQVFMDYVFRAAEKEDEGI